VLLKTGGGPGTAGQHGEREESGMTSANHERLREHFESLDVDADGHIELEEWEAPARRILEALGESDTSPKAQAVLGSYEKMWNYLVERAGPDTSRLTLGEFEHVVDNHVVNPDDADFNNALRDAISAIAGLVDRDAKGAVTPEGFTSWLRAVGADASKAREAFRRIDDDDDDDLTVDELVQAVRDYHAGKLGVSVLGA
jgi:Ca2+-binding EF-hand superfamily protein